MAFYDGLASTAERLITDKGRAVSLTYKTPGTYSAQTDTITGASTTTVSTFAAIVEYSERLIDQTLIHSGDKKAVLFAKGLEKPRAGDILTDNGIDYSIVRVGEVGPGDTPVIYNLQIRK